MNEYLLVCHCSGQKEKAELAFKIMFPHQAIPPVIKGRNDIFKLATTHQNDHIKAISKLKGRYSYYLKINSSGIIEEEYNLMNGRRLK